MWHQKNLCHLLLKMTKKAVINVTLMSTKMVTKITTLFVACFCFVSSLFSFFLII